MQFSLDSLPESSSFFGNGVSNERVSEFIKFWRGTSSDFINLLVIAGSKTSEIEGISAAGATSKSREYTAVADATLLLYGPKESCNVSLPPLPAGVSPALISYVSSKFLKINPIVLATGLSQHPSFPHLRIDLPEYGPSLCVSTGKSMSKERVDNLWERGFQIGKKIKQPLVISECVPSGTTTAQAVLIAMGIDVKDLITGSLIKPVFELKRKVIKSGLLAAQLGNDPLPKIAIAAVGDPFQAVAVGMLLGARETGQQVLLGGGSQMIAVLALALASIKPKMRELFVEGVCIATTSWLVNEKNVNSGDKGSTELLLNLVGDKYQANLFGVSSGLSFKNSRSKVLRDYELGYIKEGVGAGALSLLAQINGVSCSDLTTACENAVDELLG